MKALRIFLLVLIIIGLFALATQKLWVPKLVEKIINNENAALPQPLPEPEFTIKDINDCYVYTHEATKDEPYEVSERMNLLIQGDRITGTKTGTQKGPDMTNGYEGTLEGYPISPGIHLTYTYTIEGSTQKEEEIYRGNLLDGFEKLRYPLKEEKGVLVPDTTKKYTTQSYYRVGCSPSN